MNFAFVQSVLICKRIYIIKISEHVCFFFFSPVLLTMEFHWAFAFMDWEVVGKLMYGNSISWQTLN
jgi:hypothetical protein